MPQNPPDRTNIPFITLHPLHLASKKTVAHRTEVAGQRLRPRAPKGFAADAEGTPD
jgi:hypothetical protein